MTNVKDLVLSYNGFLSPRDMRREAQNIGGEVFGTLVNLMNDAQSERIRLEAAKQLVNLMRDEPPPDLTDEEILDDMSIEDQIAGAEEYLKKLYKSREALQRVKVLAPEVDIE